MKTTTHTYWLSATLREIDQASTMLTTDNLGASPAELDYNIESERPMSWHSHDGCPELRLWEDGFSVL